MERNLDNRDMPLPAQYFPLIFWEVIKIGLSQLAGNSFIHYYNIQLMQEIRLGFDKSFTLLRAALLFLPRLVTLSTSKPLRCWQWAINNFFPCPGLPSQCRWCCCSDTHPSSSWQPGPATAPKAPAVPPHMAPFQHLTRLGNGSKTEQPRNGGGRHLMKHD